jgi:antitoxin component YwqK of YwqJK toxin-antitoxin module
MVILSHYYKSGKLKSRETFSNGLRQGIVTWYFENGEISDYFVFKNNILNGKIFSYHYNGRIKKRSKLCKWRISEGGILH